MKVVDRTAESLCIKSHNSIKYISFCGNHVTGYHTVTNRGLNGICGDWRGVEDKYESIMLRVPNQYTKRGTLRRNTGVKDIFSLTPYYKGKLCNLYGLSDEDMYIPPLCEDKMRCLWNT